jgi:5-methylcytosine-specific restriction protein A
LLASATDAAVETCSSDVTYVVGQPGPAKLVAGLPTGPVRWQPLAVGFAERFATPAQRRALAVRDGSGCAHPGCTVPVWRTIAHHIVPWDQGGATDLPNLVLLCRFHHRQVHRGALTVIFQDGHATTIRGDRAPP